MIEVLVAVLIVSFGILGLVGLQARAVQFSVDADDRSRAALFADDLAAQMRLARSTTLPAAQVTQWTNTVQAGLPNGAVDLVVDSVNQATVTVRWRNPGQTDESRLQTVIVLTNEEIS
jgi:type IV pilus assembly protein PilV